MSETRDAFRPVTVDLDEAPDPGLAPPVPDPQGRAMQAAGRVVTGQRSALGRLALWVGGTLFGLILSVSAWDFVTGLMARNGVLGWLALALTVVALGLAAIFALREVFAFARMRRLDVLRRQAALAHGSLDEARAVAAALRRLYAARPENAWGRARLEERQGEILDADALLALTERELLGPLDGAALVEVEAAARQVATVTALVPLALADVAAALVANLRMMRRIANIYGGRSGSFGSWRLLARVMQAVMGAGAIALADDLIGSVAGGGVLAKLSRRFGEGLVNGALTVRVGVAAMETCRPMPFAALPRPGVSATVSRALAGFLSRGEG